MQSRRPSGLRKTIRGYNSLAHRTTWLRSDFGAFAYSQEENTVAGEREDQIDEEIKAERVDAVMRRQLDISFEYNKEKIGQVLQVLVEDRDEDGSYVGRTEYDAPEIDNSVLFTSERELKAGDMVRVEIIDAFDYDLVGREV